MSEKITTTQILGIGIGIGFFGVYFGVMFDSVILAVSSLAVGVISGLALRRSKD